MSRAATLRRLCLAGLMLASAGSSAQAQAPTPTPAPAEAPPPVPAPAPAPVEGQAAPQAASLPPAQAAAETVTFSCPTRGPFGPGTPYYSQFYEDYILSYVFQDVAKGTYVDVGAYDPDSGSVTKYFYLKGWRGVNVEPNPDHLAELQRRRTEDANLGVGISDAADTLTFYKFETRASGLSTFDPDTAERHKKAGFSYETLTIPVVTLTEALGRTEIVTGGFDFLNVDVEGFERKVLAGLDFTKYPPKVIMLEATAPLTEEPTQQKWEDLLFSHGYSFAMDDGLNRYYVQRTERQLQARFLEAAYCVSRDKRSKGIKLDGFMEEPVK
jgi:FkbM family methyltransferase